MKAIAWLAAERIQPVLIAVTTTALPTSADAPSAARAPSRTLARAPSEARSRTQTVPALVASTATTGRTAPADRIITGAATDIATGRSESALASDKVDWACALQTPAAST